MKTAKKRNPALQQIVLWLAENLPVDETHAAQLVEIPPSAEMGDYALPCFAMAGSLKKSPAAIAEELAEKFGPTSEVPQARSAGPYLNFFVNRALMTRHVLGKISRLKQEFGKSDAGACQTIVIDYSSPNIAKHLGVHHLRSAIIGKALYNILAALGCKCVGVNHLGDWGTGFGMLIAAYERYGPPGGGELTVSDLQELYVRFNREAEQNAELESKAREAFRRLETGEPRVVELWQRFKEISLQEFERIYRMLDISFDKYAPESLYKDTTDPMLERIQSRGIAELSNEALIVPLDEYDMPPFLLRKSDGATLYSTRDICAAERHWEDYHFHGMLYVVGSEQRLHFQQLEKVLELMGYEWADRLEHIDFGLLKFLDPETGKAQKGSTRRGEMILLEDVLKEGVKKAKEKMLDSADRFGEADDLDGLAASVGIGAVVFSTLSVKRSKDIVFDWDRMLDFEGDTGPYVQYAHARLCSIQRKAGRLPTDEVDYGLLRLPEEWNLVRKIDAFSAAVALAGQTREPSVVAAYLLELCAGFSTYYSAGMREPELRVLCSDDSTRAARLLLVGCIKQVIGDGLELLGVDAPERM